MATKTYKLSQSGQNVSGTAIAGQGKKRVLTTYVPPLLAPDERISVAYGAGVMGTRVFRSGEIVQRLTPPISAPTAGQLSFGTRRGLILGNASLGVRRPNLLQIKCSLSRYGGCLTGEILLRKKPEFDVRHRNLVYVYWRNIPVFTGTADFSDGPNSTKTDNFRIKLNGIKKQFEELTNDATVAGPIDLGQVAEDLFLGRQGYTDAQYNPSKVNLTTGVTSIGDIDFGKFSFLDIMDTLALASGHIWGVDEFADWYFLPDDTAEIDRAYIVGSDRVNMFEPYENFEALINSVAMQRQTGKGSGGAGWAAYGIFENQGSINDNGLYYLPYQVPGKFEDALVDEIGNRIISESSELRESGRAKNIPIYVSTDIIDYKKSIKMVLPRALYYETLEKCETLINFSVLDSSGGLAMSIDASTFSRGAGSLKLEYTGPGGIVLLTLADPRWENVQRIVADIRATRAGDVLNVYCGYSNYDDAVKPFPVGLENSWIAVGDSFGIRPFQLIAFEIMDSGGSGTIWIDEIKMEVDGNRHFVGAVQQVDYGFSKKGDFISGLELGPPERGIEDQIKSVKELADKTNKMLEIR